MPYYCTVPRCTSMAGKAKNVSFHQFPRDEELAKLWNDILKRGKPYTKYSKVCSLHFKPDDYTVTSVGRNKGQWRTLRKDAVPSMNLPSEVPATTMQHRGSAGCGVAGSAGLVAGVMDSQIQQQVAQAIYMQTMLAMQAAAGLADSPRDDNLTQSDGADSEEEQQHARDRSEHPHTRTDTHTSRRHMSELERYLLKQPSPPSPPSRDDVTTSYQCQQCTKCFKDPDVFLIHRRSHSRAKENIDGNTERETIDTQETLRANPILANLLRPELKQSEVMTALALNMDAYFRSFNTEVSRNDDDGDLDDSVEGSRLVVDETV